jgi:hypothetical protein
VTGLPLETIQKLAKENSSTWYSYSKQSLWDIQRVLLLCESSHAVFLKTHVDLPQSMKTMWNWLTWSYVCAMIINGVKWLTS